MSKVIFFGFMGRIANMEIARPHLTRLLVDNPDSELHLWDLTRTPEDQQYLKQWATDTSRVLYRGSVHPGHPMRCTGPRRRGIPPCRCMKHAPPYEKVWRYYADAITNDSYDLDTVFVKFDDDVLWIDTGRFGEVLEFLETHPYQVASANVANNAVCAKYEPGLREALIEEFDLGDPTNPDFDRQWWELHTDSCFAWLSHHWLLDRLHTPAKLGHPWVKPFRTREGEAVSINFIAMKGSTLVEAASRMTGRLGDEGAVDSMLPWIVPNFRVAHLSFGPQEAGMGMSLKSLRRQYAAHVNTYTPVIHI